jgi:hypothetical protein
MRARALSAVIVVVLAGCGGSQSRASGGTQDSLTERQRDSMLAKSKIPGASGVGKAMRVADSTSAGIRAADSVAP